MPTVRFTGCRERTGPLTMGQHNILLSLLRSPWQIAMVAVLERPERPAAQAVADAVGVLMARHEGLRTTYRIGTGPGDPHRQVVRGSGVVRAEVREAGPDEAARTAEDLGRELFEPFFDLEHEFPVRLGLVLVDGLVSHAVLAVSHMATDGRAMGMVIGEFEAVLAGRELPAPELHPLDVAELEREPALTRRARESVDHWEDQLRRAPHALFRPMPVREDPHLPSSLAIHSADLAEAIARISRRARVSASTVALTALSVLAALRTDSRGLGVTSSSANRSQPGLATHIGSVAMDAFLTVDPREHGSFDAVARAVGRGALKAYWNAFFDSTDLWSRITAVGQERGIVAYPRDVVFNDMSAAGPALIAAGWAGPVPCKPAAGAHFTWHQVAPIAARLALFVYRLDGEFVGALWGDPGYLSRADVLNFGHALNRLLTVCADADVDLADVAALAGFPEEPHGPGWCLSDSGWIELDRVRALMREVLGNRPFAVGTEPDAALGHRVVCRVANADGSVRPEDLRAACLAALPRHPSAIAPHDYVLCDEGTEP